MSIQNLPLMRAIGSKIQYLEKRQGVIAQNIANADTPNYQSKDLTKVDFGSVLKQVQHAGSIKPVNILVTDPQHMGSPNMINNAKNNKDRLTYEVAPDKNGVIIEEQLVKSSEIQMDFNLLTGLSSKMSGMYKIAIGRQG